MCYKNFSPRRLARAFSTNCHRSNSSKKDIQQDKNSDVDEDSQSVLHRFGSPFLTLGKPELGDGQPNKNEEGIAAAIDALDVTESKNYKLSKY